MDKRIKQCFFVKRNSCNSHIVKLSYFRANIKILCIVISFSFCCMLVLSYKLNCGVLLLHSDVERVISKLYGESPPPIILIGHRYVFCSYSKEVSNT